MRLITLLFAICCFTQIHSQVPNNLKKVLDEALRQCQQRSLYTVEINWPQVRDSLYRKAARAKQEKDLIPALQYLINSLRDAQAKVLDAKTMATLASYNDFANDRRNEYDKRLRKLADINLVDSATNKFESQMAVGRVAYLRIPGYSNDIDVKAESRKIRETVNRFRSLKIENWIIDLRYNGGGNMNPAMIGLAPLFGDGVVSSFIKASGEKMGTNEYRNGHYYLFGLQQDSLEAGPVTAPSGKIAILTSKYTLSSGELIAVSFKDMANTRFFGEATGGIPTATGLINISKNLILSVSEAVFADRNGKQYGRQVGVDEELPVTYHKFVSQDKVFLAALKWVRGQ